VIQQTPKTRIGRWGKPMTWIHYDWMMLILDPTPLARGLGRKKVEVVNYPDGRFAVQFNGAALGFKVFDKIQTVQPVGDTTRSRLLSRLRSSIWIAKRF
jgi:hypothetical protein